VCAPPLPVDGSVASSTPWSLVKASSFVCVLPLYPSLSLRAGGCHGRQVTLSPYLYGLEVRACHLSRQAQLALSPLGAQHEIAVEEFSVIRIVHLRVDLRD
jgi:hypothetical protein